MSTSFNVRSMAAQAGIQTTGGFAVIAECVTLEELERFFQAAYDAGATHVRETEFKPDWNNYQQGLADGAAAEREKWMERTSILIRGEREACAEKTGEFARKWWSIHCASNKHMDTTRKAHDDFCALQAAIRARSNS